MVDISVLIIVGIVAFALQFLDASVGMGFGEITALLILLGFAPLEVIPVVILGSAVLSLITGVWHHTYENVDFSFDARDLEIALALAGFGIVAVLIGVELALNLPEFVLKTYIGLLVAIIGITILVSKERKHKFSWKRLIGLGSLAAFNKGISGGGYGPVLAGGQILTGVKPGRAVAITALAEGLVALTGFLIFYLSTGDGVNLQLALALIIGGFVAIPFAVYAVKKVDSKILRVSVGIVSIMLGSGLLASVFF